MSSAREWLSSIGLVQFAELFDREQIDLSALPHLTDAELRALGVPTGPRLKLLATIRELHAGAPAKSAQAVDTRARPSTVAQPPDAIVAASDAERRQLSVVFCDLVGSTELAQGLDPEQYRELIRTYQSACAGVVSRYDGHIAQYLGDGVLVYFGYPAAHEDDAHRAVRAGLEMVESASRLIGPDGTLAVRVGIDTGLVVVGNMGSDGRQGQLALGDTPNLAARLQSLAAPGAVLVSDRTRSLTGVAFDYRDLGTQTLKGVAQPLRLWQALGESRVESRFDAATGGGVAPMVGRQFEYSLALQAWERARSGRGQALMLCGEPGIGKSRILRALREAAAAEGVRPWQYQCSPYFVNSALYPVINHLERVLRFERDEPVDARLDKLATLLAGYGRPQLDTNLIARLLNLPAEERLGPLSLSSQRQKDETLRALNDVTVSAANQQPVLMLVEDLHWADPTTLELLEALVKRLDRIPVMLLATYRPEYKPQWLGQAGVIAVTLTRLDAEQTRAIVMHVAKKPLPPEVLEQIVAKTDGIPLFVEELTKAIVESHALQDKGDRYDLSGPLSDVTIPSTLRDSLTARLDRLGSAKEVAQVGACIGREFTRELLALISALGPSQLEDALDQLTRSELMFRRGNADKPTYVFKHALVQDAAYDSLLKRRRTQIHAHIASALAEHFPDVRDQEPELIAHHFTHAEQPERAVPYWRKAGEIALRRLALQEAITHLDRGVELLKQISASVGRDTTELELHALLGTAWQTWRGWTSPEARNHADSAWKLTQSLGRDDHTMRILWTLFVYHLNSGQIRDSLTWADRLIREGERLHDDALVLAGHAAGVIAEQFLGDWNEVYRHAAYIEAGYDPIRHHGIADALAFDPLSVALLFRAQVLWKSGFPDQAIASSEAAVRQARAVGHGSNLCFALLVHCTHYYYLRDAARLERMIEELERVAHEHQLRYYLDFQIPNQRARALLLSERMADAVRAYQVAVEGRSRMGQRLGIGSVATIWGTATASLGRTQEALAFLEEALAQIERPGWEERTDLAEVLRTKGWVHALAGDPASAEAGYRASLDVARAQQAKSWELRTATAYARLLKDLGRCDEALTLLAPIYEWFIEGFDTRDLRDAKALLEELRRTAA